MVDLQGGGFRLDQVDCNLLDLLQQDGRLTYRELSERIGLSPSACLARVKRMEDLGVISGYHADIAIELVCPSLFLVAALAMKRHGPGEFRDFDRFLQTQPAVVEAMRISGPFDYMLKIVVTDMREWRELNRLLLRPEHDVERIVSHFQVEEVKQFQGYPMLPGLVMARGTP